jgi:hypothetical protein
MKPSWYFVTQNKMYKHEGSMGIEKHFNRYVNL